ncbi:signal transduction histidine kinase [Striga asiatica]|uniref:Signal transduction histidine kinase n=1 Tax=Striga asiatica TaxID=4170 RepID=A0A5A7QL15_STRAF|nr:signal transduction histidine kinase [Striga asiatica]
MVNSPQTKKPDKRVVDVGMMDQPLGGWKVTRRSTCLADSQPNPAAININRMPEGTHLTRFDIFLWFLSYVMVSRIETTCDEMSSGTVVTQLRRRRHHSPAPLPIPRSRSTSPSALRALRPRIRRRCHTASDAGGVVSLISLTIGVLPVPVWFSATFERRTCSPGQRQRRE